MARVVLSHASTDKPAVRRIAVALRAVGHDTWLDEQTFPPGAVVPERSLHDADFVIICLSKTAKSWIEDFPMPLLALGEGHAQIVTVRLEDVARPHLVAGLAYVDLFPDDQAFNRGIDRLTRSIAAYTARNATTGDADVVSSPAAPGTEPPLSQRRRPRKVPERFLVALSFSGVEREFVRTIAEALERRLGSTSVFFDEWFEFYIAGHDADMKLQHIYGAGCDLAVVCVSATYGGKAWTRVEHEAIRARLMQARTEQDPRQRDRILPIRVGDGNVDGIPFNAIVPDVRGRTPEQVAELIVDRLQFVMGSVEPAALPSVGSLEASVAPMGRFPADEQGRPAVSLEGLHDSGRPQLHLRAGVDADRLVLAGSGASPPGLSISIQPQVDIGILTIRDDEFRAVLDVFPEIGRYRGPHREYALRRADAGGGDGYMAAVIRQSEQGNGEAQDAARDLIEDLAPRLLIVVGIAGGVPSDDLTLGDVIIATRIHDFTVEARNAKEPTEYAVSGGPITRDVAALVANLAAREAELGDWTAGLPEPPPVRWTKKQLYGPDSWQDKLRSALQRHHGKGKPPRRPRYIDGVIASSDRLVEDPGLLFPWITTARNILAVEMESAGVYRAARERCPMLAIRGISDIVGLKRAEAWTAYACRSAAAFTRAFLRTRPVPAGRRERPVDALPVTSPGQPRQPPPGSNPVPPDARPRSPAASEPPASATVPTIAVSAAPPATAPEAQRATEPAAGPGVASPGAHGGRAGGDHIDVHNRLLKAGDAMFERILMYEGVDRSLFPPPTAELAKRVLEVARRARVDSQLNARLVALLDEHAPWTRNKTASSPLDPPGGREIFTPASGASPGSPGPRREIRIDVSSGTAADQLAGSGNVAPGKISAPARPAPAAEITGAAPSATTTSPEAPSPARSVPEGARSVEADERLAGMKREVAAMLRAHPLLIQPLADRLGCDRVPEVIADRLFGRTASDVVALLLNVWDAQSSLPDGHTDCQAAHAILCIVLPYVPDWRDEVDQIRAGKEEIVLGYSSATIAEAVMAGGTGRRCSFEHKAGAAPHGKWAVELPSDQQTAAFTSADHVRDSVVEMLDRQLGVGGLSPAARRLRVRDALQRRRRLKGPYHERRYLLFRDAEHPELLAMVRTALQGETGLPDLLLVRLCGSGEDNVEAGVEDTVRLMLQPRTPR